ncbi:MAG: GNAT family N-acetyltransferase [Bacteroidota bacterium]|nr:GNAT family N-acetyltransferase [Bacteroidota bacterium]
MLQLQHIASEGEALNSVRQLFREYVAELNEDLCFQSFEEELRDPLQKYGPPKGSLILAYWNAQPVGCIALTNITKDTDTTHYTCEMKRLYVQPAFRKHHIGNALVEAILHNAVQLGYRIMKLDTLERLQPAISLYKKYGFTEATAYYQNPLPGVVYMQKLLSA